MFGGIRTSALKGAVKGDISKTLDVLQERGILCSDPIGISKNITNYAWQRFSDLFDGSYGARPSRHVSVAFVLGNALETSYDWGQDRQCLETAFILRISRIMQPSVKLNQLELSMINDLTPVIERISKQLKEDPLFNQAQSLLENAEKRLGEE